MRRAPLLAVAFSVVTCVAGFVACVGDSSNTVVPSTDGGSGCLVGNESCACTTGGACNPGLMCLSNVCVNPNKDAGSTPGTDGGGTPGTDSGSSTNDGGNTGSDGGDGGCKALFASGIPGILAITVAGQGLAVSSVSGNNGAIQILDATGKVIATPASNNINIPGQIASSANTVVWVEGLNIKSYNLTTTLTTMPVALGEPVNAIAATDTNVYFTKSSATNAGVFYCPQGSTPCTPMSGFQLVAASTVAPVPNIDSIGASGNVIYWTDATAATLAAVAGCQEGACAAATLSYGPEPHHANFFALGVGGKAVWTSVNTGAVDGVAGNIVQKPAGDYYGIATDGTNVFFQVFDTGLNKGAIYAASATGSMATATFISDTSFPKTLGTMPGVVYGPNKKFYWIDQAAGSIYSWAATCPL